MESKKYKYSPNQNYCDDAKKFQSVPDREQYAIRHLDVKPEDYDTNRAKTLYSCPDDYKMASIQDNQIYIATTDGQHEQIVRGEHVDAQGGLSGYFSDQATVDACISGNALDNAKYNEMCQIAPYREGGISGGGDATYKPHIDCFELDRESLYKNYGTYDFNAAISKCEANNQFGGGGGNQGYNPHIDEMIDNGSLKYNKDKSYSDTSISISEYKNTNNLTNGIVDKEDYRDMMRDAQTRSQDCVKNNTAHPSEAACQNGFPKNEHPIESNTGNAVRGQKPSSDEVISSQINSSTVRGNTANETSNDLQTPISNNDLTKASSVSNAEDGFKNTSGFNM